MIGSMCRRSKGAGCQGVDSLQARPESFLRQAPTGYIVSLELFFPVRIKEKILDHDTLRV